VRDEAERAARIVANEARFRQVNEELVGLMVAESPGDTMDVVCECGQAACAELVPLSRAEYEAVRSDPTQFAVKPGHEVIEVEDVVLRSESFFVVRKREGLPAAIAEVTDTRS
jgi:hypothetical protein